MLGQFIQVIAGAAPPAVVLALALAQVRAAGRGRAWAGALLWGVLAGAVGGLTLTVLRETTTLVNRETVNLWTIAPAVALELWFAAWMWLARPLRPATVDHAAQSGSRRGRRAVNAEAAPGWAAEAKQSEAVGAEPAGAVAEGATRMSAGPRHEEVAGLAGRRRRLSAAVAVGALALMAALVTLRAVPAVALQLTGFVVPGESPASTEMLLRVLGFVGGACLVWAACLTLTRSASGAPRRVRLVCSSSALAIVVVFQLVLVLRAVRAQWRMTLPSWLFRAMAWLINHQAWETAALVLVSAAIPVAAWALARRRGVARAANPAEARLGLAAARSRRRYARAVLVSYAAMGLAVTLGVAVESRGPQLSPPEPFAIADGLAVIPLELLADGHLHRFAYTTPKGTVVRFIVIKKNGVAYGVGLDACEVCGDTGYYEKDGKIICRLCDVVMNIATIGFKGGCNPIPLDYDLADGSLTVSLADLESGAEHFA
ncbi:MAG: DUF2318 domain-containing protein [Bifidobacteriaceae bacterium]|nr:DUF2318 domain-containing protein [Bifidobacteriaceae bacterium]